jgi:hypothetical protein
MKTQRVSIIDQHQEGKKWDNADKKHFPIMAKVVSFLSQNLNDAKWSFTIGNSF